MAQAECALFLILVTSLAPIRHAHYQVFLAAHQILVAVFLFGAWMHCYIDQLPHQIYVNIALAVWGFERLHRLFTIFRKNIPFGKLWSANTAEIQVVPSGEDAVRVSITMNKGWTYEPGQHAYLYVPQLSWTQSHPFSVAWSTTSPSIEDVQMLPLMQASTLAVVNDKPYSSQIGFDSSTTLAHQNLVTAQPRTTIHFIVSRRHGFTDRLFRAAASGARARFLDPEKADHPPEKLRVFVEGPFSNEASSFDSFPTLLFVAGGSGITHPLGYIRHLLNASSENLVAAKRIKLAWVVRDRRNIGWVSDWLDELWRLDAGREMLEVEIYVTRPSSRHGSDRVGGRREKWFAGRPQMEVVLAGMIAPSVTHGRRGALAVNGHGRRGALAVNGNCSQPTKANQKREHCTDCCFSSVRTGQPSR